MTEESRTPAHEEIAAAVRAEIGRLVPGTPLPGAAAAASAPRSRCGAPRVTDSSVMNGQYRALEARVDDLRGNYQELRHDMDARFTTLSAEISKQADNTNARLDSIATAISNKGNGDFTKYAGVFGIIVAIASGIIGGFIKLENDSIGDKITTQGAALSSAIAAQNATLTSSIAELKKTAGDDIKRVEKRQDAAETAFIGRPELTGWKTDLAGVQAELRRTQDDHTKTLANLVSDVAYIKNDVERFKSIAVSRSEIDSNKNDVINRINLLSNRISEMSKDNAGLPIIVENQKQIRSDLNDLTRKFVVVPGSQGR